MASLHSFMIVVSVAIISLTGTTSAGEERSAVPDAPEQGKALTLLKDTCGKDMRSSDPKVRLKVGMVLLSQNDRADNAAMRYVLLTKAAELSAGAGDVDTALEAADILGKLYDVDLLEIKLSLLEKAYKAAKNPEIYAQIAERYSALVQTALRQNAFSAAAEAARQASNAARRAKNDSLKARTKGLKDMVREVEKHYKNYIAGMVTLKQTPDDAKANLMVGEHLALIKGEWTKGLPFLAKSADIDLANIAGVDLRNPTLPEVFLEVANFYYDLAQKRNKGTLAQNGLLVRAKTYYKRALPSLEGLAKAQAEKTIALIPDGPEESNRDAPSTLQVKFDEKRSMPPYPAGTRKFNQIPPQKGEDPVSPFFGNPMYYNQEAGQHLYFSIRSPKKVASIVLTGCAFFNCVIEVTDKNGKLIGESGPHNIRNQVGTYTIEIKPSQAFEFHIHNPGLPLKAGCWFCLQNIELK